MKNKGLSTWAAGGIAAGVLGLSALIGRRNAPDPSHPRIRRWYARLDKPGFTPPDMVFGAVWPVLETLAGVKIAPSNLERGLTARITPATVSVVVRGTRERIAGLGAGDLRAEVNLADLGRGRHDVTVVVPNREGFAVESVEPATVTVTIR